jgi:arsenate reductase
MHWGYQSPAKVRDRRPSGGSAYERVFRQLGERIRQFVLIAGRTPPAVATRLTRVPSVAREPIRILVLCTGNSCRSILAEALFRELAGDLVSVSSAGSRPAGAVNPHTDPRPRRAGHRPRLGPVQADDRVPRSRVRPRHHVCDDAAEVCPVFPGPAQRTHWSIPDPAVAIGSDDQQMAAVPRDRSTISGQRIASFLDTLDR